MDSGEGRFIPLEEDPLERQRAIVRLRKKYPKSKGIFSVGEEVEIKGSKFEITKIFGKAIHLKLLKAGE